MNNFNFLRLLLATLVIFSHAYLIGNKAYPDHIAAALGNQIDQIGDHPMEMGHMSVYGFFVISGFLISMSFVRSQGSTPGQKVENYLKKRALRIYPGFLVAVLLCIFVFGPLGAADPHLYWSSLQHHPKVFKEALNLSVSWDKPPFLDTLTTIPYPHDVDGSLWTVRYEFLCYLMLAGLGTLGMLLSRHVPRWTMRFCPAFLFLASYTLYVGFCMGISALGQTTCVLIS